MLTLDKVFEHIPAQIHIFLLLFIGGALHSYHLTVSVKKREQKQVKCTIIHQISIRKKQRSDLQHWLKGPLAAVRLRLLHADGLIHGLHLQTEESVR